MLFTAGPALAIDNYLATGVAAYDKYDLPIKAASEYYGHPLAELLKSQAWWESDEVFNPFSTSLDTPCGIPAGWTSAESRSFGLFQITPACGEGVPDMMKLNDRPNLSQSRSNANYTNSVYNESLNIYLSVRSITEGFYHFKTLWPTCPDSVLAKHAAAGWVGNWEDMPACGNFGPQYMQDYLTNVIGFYETYYGPYPTN